MKLRQNILMILAILSIVLVAGCAPKVTLRPAGDGLEMVLKVESNTSDEIRTQYAGVVADMAKKRLEIIGVRDADVKTGVDAAVIIRVFSVKDRDMLVNLVAKPVMVEMRLVDESTYTEEDPEVSLPPNRKTLFQNEFDPYIGEMKKVPYLIETDIVFNAGNYIEEVKLKKDHNPDQTFLLVQLSMQGTKLFGNFTASHVNRRLAVIIDDRVYFTAMIRGKIQGGKFLVEGFSSNEEAAAMARILAAGPYSEDVQIISVKEF